MADNEILPFAGTDNGTNLLTQAQYLADAQRLIGNAPGVARLELVNKALRQTSLMSAGLAQFIADLQATAVTDDLTPAKIATMLRLSNVGNGASIYTAAGGTANAITATFSPARPDHMAGVRLYIEITATNTDAVTLNVDGLGPLPLTKFNGAAMQPGDLPAGQIIAVTCNRARTAYSMMSPVAAGNRQGVINVSAAATLLAVQSGCLVVLSGSAGYTTTLPAPAVGRSFQLVNLGSVAMSLAAGGASFVGGMAATASTLSLPPGGSIEVVGNGANWCIISLLANTYALSNPGLERLSNGLTRMWGNQQMPAMVNSNAQSLGGATYYTNYSQIIYPLALIAGPYTASVTLGSGDINSQYGMAGCTVSCNLHGGGSPLTRLDVAITMPMLGWTPWIHWEVIGK